mmetsp:Transcript_37469/g.105803  ORF Transcript_37469/g.105803 Transcript_37469/m.105803 type:complete len:355 (+) Transcript_37469:85-1149(+)
MSGRFDLPLSMADGEEIDEDAGLPFNLLPGAVPISYSFESRPAFESFLSRGLYHDSSGSDAEDAYFLDETADYEAGYRADVDQELLCLYTSSEFDAESCCEVRPFSAESEAVGGDFELETAGDDCASPIRSSPDSDLDADNDIHEALYALDHSELDEQPLALSEEMLAASNRAIQWRNSSVFQRVLANVYSGPGAAIRRDHGHPSLLRLPDRELQLPGMVNLEEQEESRALHRALLNLGRTLIPQASSIPKTHHQGVTGSKGYGSWEQGRYRATLSEGMKEIVDDEEFIDDVMQSLPGVDPQASCIQETLIMLRRRQSNFLRGHAAASSILQPRSYSNRRWMPVSSPSYSARGY